MFAILFKIMSFSYVRTLTGPLPKGTEKSKICCIKVFIMMPSQQGTLNSSLLTGDWLTYIFRKLGFGGGAVTMNA